MKKITRNGLPDRYVIDGWRALCTDEVGFTEFEKLREKYSATVDSVETRKMLRGELDALYKRLLYEGRLFRKDGGKLY